MISVRSQYDLSTPFVRRLYAVCTPFVRHLFLYSHAPNPQVHHSTQAMKGQQATGNCTPFVRRLYANLRTSVRSQYALCTLVCVHQYDLGTECTKFARCWSETRTALYTYSDLKKYQSQLPSTRTYSPISIGLVRNSYDIRTIFGYPYDIRTISVRYLAYIRRTSGVHQAPPMYASPPSTRFDRGGLPTWAGATRRLTN